jgi:hypothetical protein
LRAARLPDARRILGFGLEDTAIEAAVEAWREDGRRGAFRIIGTFPAGVHNLDESYWIQAKILIGASLLKDDPDGGPICLKEADELLAGHLGADFLAQAEAFGARCRRGGVLPDALPPAVQLASAPGDPFLADMERRDHLRLALALAEVRRRERLNDSAFALAALCYNLEPQDREARTTIAWLYDVALMRKDIAQGLQAQWAAGG